MRYAKFKQLNKKLKWKLIKTKECEMCHGRGILGQPDFTKQILCPDCKGNGYVDEL